MSRSTKRGLLLGVALVVACILLAVFAPKADSHAISGWKKVVDTRVNGLCGQGAPICYVPTIRGRWRYDSGHWRVYEVEWYNIKPILGPWGTHRCRADKVWVEHGTRIGAKTKPDLCWK
jgi:hypothetical protein